MKRNLNYMALKPLTEKTGSSSGSQDGIPEVLLGRMGFLLNRGGQRVREVYQGALEPLGIDGKQWGVLLVLNGKGSISQHEIGLCTHIDRTTMVAIIDDLEQKGLVERQEHPTDRRSHALVLTAKGKDLIPKGHKLSEAAEKKFLAALSPREQKEVVKLLRKLILSHFTDHANRGTI
jgi:DNA-binding MarR family transcriptional regulator